MAIPEIIAKLVESKKDWSDYLTLATNHLSPILTAIFGFWILRITKKIEHSHWRNQKLIEKRIAVWDDVGSGINDIFSYCMRVGAWKNLSPQDVISWKREVDKKIHVNRLYFSPLFFTKYMEFINTCFATFQGHGLDAKFKTRIDEHKSSHKNWQSEWDILFHDTSIDEKEFSKRYLALQYQLSVELNE